MIMIIDTVSAAVDIPFPHQHSVVENRSPIRVQVEFLHIQQGLSNVDKSVIITNNYMFSDVFQLVESLFFHVREQTVQNIGELLIMIP